MKAVVVLTLVTLVVVPSLVDAQFQFSFGGSDGGDGGGGGFFDNIFGGGGSGGGGEGDAGEQAGGKGSASQAYVNDPHAKSNCYVCSRPPNDCVPTPMDCPCPFGTKKCKIGDWYYCNAKCKKK